MPSREPEDDDSGPPPERDGRPGFLGALSNFMLKPADAGADESRKKAMADVDGPTTVPEIEAAIKRADDKERIIGLLAAPIAAAIGLLITASLLANNPKALLSNGQLNKLHVNPSTYLELGLVALVLAVLMLAAAWFRKRLLLGVAMALYGLSIFNLHFWGFGIPFVMFGAWLLVRSYRLQAKLKEAKGVDGPGYRSATQRPTQPSKRYTPPTAPPRR
jgi:hypothetical protein